MFSLQRGGLTFCVVSAVLLCIAGPIQAGGKNDRQLALLFGAPQEGAWGDAANNDLQLVHHALRSKGFHASQIITLSGDLTPTLVLDVLKDAHRRIADWPDGQVVLYYTGSGYFPSGKKSAKGLETGWHLRPNPDRHVLWNEIFAALDVPRGVRLLLFPDCCYTNTLAPDSSANKTPPGIYGMILKGKGEDFECQAGNGIFVSNGEKRRHGILTYYAAQALKTADTLDEWVSQTMTLYRNGIANKHFDSVLEMTMVPLGDPRQPLFQATRPVRRE